MWNFQGEAERERDQLIDLQRARNIFHSARKLKIFDRCCLVAPRNANVMFVRFSGTNGPKDCVFF